MKALIIIILVFLISCTLKKKSKNFNRKLVYPYGNYKHLVSVYDINNKIIRNLQGIVSHRKGKIKVIGFSPLGMTLFKIVDDRKSIKYNFYIKKLELMKNNLKPIYSLIKAVMMADPSNLESENGFLVDSSFWKGKMKFLKFDKKKIPKLVKIKLPKFNLVIEVSDYELQNDI